MSLLSWLRKRFAKPEKPPLPPLDFTDLPNPFIPWEIWGHFDSPWCMRNSMGVQDNWMWGIWAPYWRYLAPAEREALYAQAPTDEWREWLKMRDDMIDERPMETHTEEEAIWLRAWEHILEKSGGKYTNANDPLWLEPFMRSWLDEKEWWEERERAEKAGTEPLAESSLCYTLKNSENSDVTAFPKIRKAALYLLYGLIPLCLYLSLFRVSDMNAINGYVIILTLLLLPFLTSKNYKINALHGSILFVCPLLYSWLSGLYGVNDLGIINLLKSFNDLTLELQDMRYSEFQERIASAIGWMVISYPLFFLFYYLMHFFTSRSPSDEKNKE